jgi:hypothetical protein
MTRLNFGRVVFGFPVALFLRGVLVGDTCSCFAAECVVRTLKNSPKQEL